MKFAIKTSLRLAGIALIMVNKSMRRITFELEDAWIPIHQHVIKKSYDFLSQILRSKKSLNILEFQSQFSLKKSSSFMNEQKLICLLF